MLAHQPSVSSIVAAFSDQASCTALVTGPGTGSSTSSHALTGCASLVVDARKTSLAPRTTSIGSSTSRPPYHSRTSPLVTPATHPLSSVGVRSSPSTTQKTLDPVPSQRFPARLAITASPAPRSCAWASITTFSPYDVVLSPASAPRSLRGHGTLATWVDSPASGSGAATTTSVGSPSPRPLPSGAGPAV